HPHKTHFARTQMVSCDAQNDPEKRSPEQWDCHQQPFLRRAQMKALRDKGAKRTDQRPQCEARIEVQEGAQQGRPVPAAFELSEIHFFSWLDANGLRFCLHLADAGGGAAIFSIAAKSSKPPSSTARRSESCVVLGIVKGVSANTPSGKLRTGMMLIAQNLISGCFEIGSSVRWVRLLAALNSP